MRTGGFDSAIAALGHALVIDEMKLSNGQVHLCIGHSEQMHLEWDEFGRAFGRRLVDEGEEGYELSRLPEFDLKFE